MDQAFKVIRFSLMVIGAIAGLVMFMFNTFATSERVRILEESANHNTNILCAMAIDLKLPSAKSVCVRGGK